MLFRDHEDVYKAPVCSEIVDGVLDASYPCKCGVSAAASAERAANQISRRIGRVRRKSHVRGELGR